MKAYTALEDLEQDLGFSAKTLYGLSNHLDKHYRNAFIPKHDGSKRKLSVPDTILKKVQRSISDNILSHYTISRYATAYTSGSSVQKNASLHVGKQKILKLDVDGFFDHLTYARVKDCVFCKENYFLARTRKKAKNHPRAAGVVGFDFVLRLSRDMRSASRALPACSGCTCRQPRTCRLRLQSSEDLSEQLLQRRLRYVLPQLRSSRCASCHQRS